jgi:membrane protein
LVALGAVVVIPVVLNYLLLSDFADLLVRTARWPAMFIVLRWLSRVSAASGLAARRLAGDGLLGAVLARPSYGPSLPSVLRVYGQLRQVHETYGSLGAASGFMTWLWISAT